MASVSSARPFELDESELVNAGVDVAQTGAENVEKQMIDEVAENITQLEESPLVLDSTRTSETNITETSKTQQAEEINAADDERASGMELQEFDDEGAQEPEAGGVDDAQEPAQPDAVHSQDSEVAHSNLRVLQDLERATATSKYKLYGEKQPIHIIFMNITAELSDVPTYLCQSLIWRKTTKATRSMVMDSQKLVSPNFVNPDVWFRIICFIWFDMAGDEGRAKLLADWFQTPPIHDHCVLLYNPVAGYTIVPMDSIVRNREKKHADAQMFVTKGKADQIMNHLIMKRFLHKDIADVPTVLKRLQSQEAAQDAKLAAVEDKKKDKIHGNILDKIVKPVAEKKKRELNAFFQYTTGKNFKARSAQLSTMWGVKARAQDVRKVLQAEYRNSKAGLPPPPLPPCPPDDEPPLALPPPSAHAIVHPQPIIPLNMSSELPTTYHTPGKDQLIPSYPVSTPLPPTPHSTPHQPMIPPSSHMMMPPPPKPYQPQPLPPPMMPPPTMPYGEVPPYGIPGYPPYYPPPFAPPMMTHPPYHPSPYPLHPSHTPYGHPQHMYLPPTPPPLPPPSQIQPNVEHVHNLKRQIAQLVAAQRISQDREEAKVLARLQYDLARAEGRDYTP